MTRTEFKQIGDDVLTEYLPKVKATDRNEALDALFEELSAQGLDSDVLEDDQVPDSEDTEEESYEENDV